MSFPIARFWTKTRPLESSTQIWVERCQSPSRWTWERGFEKPFNDPSSFKTSKCSSLLWSVDVIRKKRGLIDALVKNCWVGRSRQRNNGRQKHDVTFILDETKKQCWLIDKMQKKNYLKICRIIRDHQIFTLHLSKAKKINFYTGINLVAEITRQASLSNKLTPTKWRWTRKWLRQIKVYFVFKKSRNMTG